MSNIQINILNNINKNIPTKKAFLESIQDKPKKQNPNTKNLINLQSSIFLDANKYFSIGLNSQQTEDYEISKVTMEKGVGLFKEILNNESGIQDKKINPNEIVKKIIYL